MRRLLHRLAPSGGIRLHLSIWLGAAVSVVVLLALARVRPGWPWFSVGVYALLGCVALLAVGRFRAALGLSRTGATLSVLTAVIFFNFYLFHLERHRQRSERFEVRGVYLAPEAPTIRVGVGFEGLDVRLQGSLDAFQRWYLDLEPEGSDAFVVRNAEQVDMIRVRSPGRLSSRLGRLTPVLGAEVDRRALPTDVGGAGPDTTSLRLLRNGSRGTLAWGAATADLSLDDPILDRRMEGRLDGGMSLAELEWSAPRDRETASNLVLTRVRPGRTFGRLRITMPGYRVVERSHRGAVAERGLPLRLGAGDTLWITSRGRTWAFAPDRAAGISRAAPPIAIHFVQRPRPTGWALPPSETCGRERERCALVSLRGLPPPRPHFDLSGFGLDTLRFALTARLETPGDEVRVVGAREVLRFPVEEVHPVPVTVLDGSDVAAGLIVRVHRSGADHRGGMLGTLLSLYLVMAGALMLLWADPTLAGRLRGRSPHARAAWTLLDVFLVILGVRLALGLRVAYAPPFYDRGAETAIGLWLTFAALLVLLGRWSAWAPRVWRLVARLERPLSRIFLPHLQNGGEGRGPSAGPVREASRTRRAAGGSSRLRTVAGLVLLLGGTGWLIWQRPEIATALPVAMVGIGAWLAMGILRPDRRSFDFGRHALTVVTADADTEHPYRTYRIAALAAVGLAVATQAPALALAPVLALLVLFGVGHLFDRLEWPGSLRLRALTLHAFATALVLLAAVALFEPPAVVAAVVLLTSAGALAYLVRPWSGVTSAGDEASGAERPPSRLDVLFRRLVDLGRSVFAGLGWVGVLVVLGLLAFLEVREMPAFIRFALVFLLFLLAIRAGLACRQVLDEGGRYRDFEALGLLGIPLGVLFFFMLFDFGLGLVFFVPMFLTVLLAARIDRLPVPMLLGSLAVAASVSWAAWSVLRPDVGQLRGAKDLASFSHEFERVGNPVVDLLRAGGAATPVTRATVRSIAASEPELLEQALAFAGPSEALSAAAPSLEQVWGGRAYAASGWMGTGFAGTTLLGRGVPTAVSYAENTFSVYVLSEHGALGGVAVLLLYLSLLVTTGVWVFGVRGFIQDSPEGRTVVSIVVGGALWLTLPAVYVASSNLGIVPLTGQNMPFLGLNSWADVILVSGVSTAMLAGLTVLDSRAPGTAAPEPALPRKARVALAPGADTSTTGGVS